MAPSDFHHRSQHVWELVRAQHGVISRAQLLAFGFTQDAIRHRLAVGRLFPLYRGVYSVGRPDVSRQGRWSGALLATGPTSVLSGRSAAAAWRIVEHEEPTDVTIDPAVRRQVPGVAIRRARIRTTDVVALDGLRVTGPARTLLDLAPVVALADLERHVNTADKLGLIDPERLRAAVGEYAGLRGAKRLRNLLDRRTFVMTDSELERRFLPIVEAAGLPQPITGAPVNGYLVDFFWPDLRLVVETDGLRYHRTAAAQTRDRQRDQAHAAAGMTPLRFTHAQVRFESGYVRVTLARVARRLEASARHQSGNPRG